MYKWSTNAIDNTQAIEGYKKQVTELKKTVKELKATQTKLENHAKCQRYSSDMEYLLMLFFVRYHEMKQKQTPKSMPAFKEKLLKKARQCVEQFLLSKVSDLDELAAQIPKVSVSPGKDTDAEGSDDDITLSTSQPDDDDVSVYVQYIEDSKRYLTDMPVEEVDLMCKSVMDRFKW